MGVEGVIHYAYDTAGTDTVPIIAETSLPGGSVQRMCGVCHVWMIKQPSRRYDPGILLQFA